MIMGGGLRLNRGIETGGVFIYNNQERTVVIPGRVKTPLPFRGARSVLEISPNDVWRRLRHTSTHAWRPPSFAPRAPASRNAPAARRGPSAPPPARSVPLQFSSSPIPQLISQSVPPRKRPGLWYRREGVCGTVCWLRLWILESCRRRRLRPVAFPVGHSQPGLLSLDVARCNLPGLDFCRCSRGLGRQGGVLAAEGGV